MVRNCEKLTFSSCFEIDEKKGKKERKKERKREKERKEHISRQIFRKSNEEMEMERKFKLWVILIGASHEQLPFRNASLVQ